MKNKTIEFFRKQMEEIYSESRELLLSQSCYNSPDIDFKNVKLFLLFLESTLEQPYNRLCALSVFINNSEHFRTDLMYPFALLTIQAKNEIEGKEAQGIKLATALDIGEIDLTNHPLIREEHLTN